MKRKNEIRQTIIVSLIITIGFILYHCLNVNANISITTDNSKHSSKDSSSYLANNKGTLTIVNVGENDKLSAYKILDIFYKQSSETISYEFTSEFKNFLQSQSNPSWKTLTEDQYMALNRGNATMTTFSNSPAIEGGNTVSNDYAKLMSAYATHVRDRDNLSSITGTQLNTSGTQRTAQLDVGTYLVVATETSNVYAVMVGNIELTREGSSWMLTNATIKAKVSSPTITKTCSYDDQSGASISATKGKEVTCKVSTSFPTYPQDATTTSENATITLTESKIDKSTNYAGYNITMGGYNYTIANNQINQISNQENIGQINNYGDSITLTLDRKKISGKTMEVQYSFTFNPASPITFGQNGYSIPAKYDYPAPYSYTDSITKTTEAKIYTYALQITGTGVGNTGGTFEVYKKSGNVKVGTVELGVMETGKNAIGVLEGIAGGEYYIKQTKAPDGYAILNTTPTITVGPGGTEMPDKKGYYNITAYNTENQNQILPFTGGIGTLIFVVIGIVIIVVAIIIVMKTQKNASLKKEKPDQDEKQKEL